MGSGASSNNDMGGIPPSLALNQKKNVKYWDSFKAKRLALLATFRMKGHSGSLWQEPRSERHPWKKLLHEAEAEVQEKKANFGTLTDIEKEPAFCSLMEGYVSENTVTKNSKEVWVFISSTFTDTLLERDTLMEDVYPYIRSYARKLGLDFNAVDFRWGIRKSLCNQHKAAEICLTEVERCKKVSCGPCFVIILGQKYGFRPIPPEIKQKEFEKIVSYIERLAENDPNEVEGLQLIRQWFKLDQNEIDPVYVLQPIGELLPKFYEDDQAAGEDWDRISTIMQKSLFKAIRGAGLDSETVHLLTMSITEGEIVEGLENMPETENFRCFVFNRFLTNFNESESHAAKYIDFQNGSVDADSQSRLGTVRDHMKTKIPATNYHRYNLKFLQSQEDMMADEQNRRALQNFADQFCHFMISAIQKGAIEANIVNEHPLYSEVLNHSLFAKERAESFEGREEVLDGIDKAMKSSKMVLIFGNGGCGKTSLLCKVFTQNINRCEDKPDRPLFIMRLIGTTPKSSNIRDLLRSLCLQLLHCFKMEEAIPVDFKSLQLYFASLLERVPLQRQLCIFLDSLDQLSNEDNACELEWMPRKVPENVKFVLSVRSEAGACLAAAKNLADESIKVLPLGEKDKVDILELLLKKRGRKLTFQQEAHILNGRNPLALYIRLVSDIAANWRSYTPISECKLATTTTGLIEQFFSELERKHGETFVRSALGYLTASKDGLSAGELLDILSCDEVVLDEVFEFHIPPIRRLPPLLWTRLRVDLGPYLVEGGSETIVLYRWHHRLFHEAAHSRYVAESAPFFHQSLANYFMSRWADTPKPYHDKVTKSVQVAYRRVQAQPLFLDNGPMENGQRKYNMRKLSELPTHLIQGAMWDQAEQVLCCIPWIVAMCQTKEIHQLLVQLNEASNKCPKKVKFRDFYKMIRANTSILEGHPELVCQQALNEPDKSSCVLVARSHLKAHASEMFCLLNLSKSQSTNPEVMTLTHPAAVTAIHFSKDGNLVATASDDRMVRAWIVTSGNLEMEHEADAFRLIWPGHCQWLGALTPKGIKLIGLGNGAGLAKGQVFRNISIELDGLAQAFVPKNNKHLFTVVAGRLSIYNISSGAIIQKKELKCRPSAVAFASNGKLLAVAYKLVYLWDITKETKTKEFVTNKKDKDFNNSMLAFSSDCKRLMAVLPSGTFIWNVKGNNTKCIGHPLCLNCVGADAVCSAKLDFLVSLTNTSAIELLRFHPKTEWIKLLGHQDTVLCCDFCIGPEKNTLLGTGSKDNSVRIWDTTEVSSETTVKIVRHKGQVVSTLFSGDGTKAVSSGKDNIFMWTTQCNPPLASTCLAVKPSCDTKTVAAISEDGLFVAGFCGRGGVDVWFENRPRAASNPMMVDAEHIIVPYASPNYLFVKFINGLMACFTTLNKMGTVFLYEIMSKNAMDDWRNQPEAIMKWKDYQQNVTHFVLDESYQFHAAAIGPGGDQLATLTIQGEDDPLHSTLVLGKKEDFLKGPMELRLWDVASQSVQRVIPIDGSSSRYHRISYLGSNPLVFFQERQNLDRSKLKTRSRDGAKSSRLCCLQSSVSLFQRTTGQLVYSSTVAGNYTDLHVPDGRYVHEQFPASMQAQMLVLSHQDGEVLSLSRVGLSPVKAKFAHRLIRVTCHTLSSDCQSIMVGLEDGQVLFLRVAQIDHPQFKK